MLLNNEVMLLLLCARTQLNEEQHKVVRELTTSSIDWWNMYHLSVRHGIVPLVYSTLNSICRNRVPADVLDQLKQDVQLLVRRNLLLLKELLHLTELLKGQRIASIPYKGPLLALMAYGNIGLREFGDLDILIHKRDFVCAKQVLCEAGYVPDASINKPDAIYIQQHHDYRFIHRTTGMIVELQWGVMQLPVIFPTDLDQWWKHTEMVELSGKSIPTFLPERLLLILCVHGAKHMWKRLRWLCDIAELLRAYPQLDWDIVLQLARQTHSERMLFLCLLLARDLLDTALPQDVAQQVEQNNIAIALAAEVQQQFVSPLSDTDITYDAAPLFYLRMVDRLHDRVRFCMYCYSSLLHPRRIFRLYGLQPFKYLLKG